METWNVLNETFLKKKRGNIRGNIKSYKYFVVATPFLTQTLLVRIGLFRKAHNLTLY